MGKKYIIEIDETPYTQNGKSLYRAVNFSSLVFDSYGLSLLEEYKEPEPEIRVGDLVKTEGGNEILVTHIDKKYFGGFNIDKKYYVGFNTEDDQRPIVTWSRIEIKRIKKILKHYDCIETVLEDLKK